MGLHKRSDSPGPVDLRLVRLPPSAARGELEVRAIVLEDGGRLAAGSDEDLYRAACLYVT